MYKGYYEADPSHRTPPIPTVFLDTPGTPEGTSQRRSMSSCMQRCGLAQSSTSDNTHSNKKRAAALCMFAELVALCYSSDLMSSNAHLEAAMEVIYDGLLRLEAELHMLLTHGRDVSRISGEISQNELSTDDVFAGVLSYQWQAACR